MRLLMLTRYDRRGASSRVRALQYVGCLQGAGFQVQVAPLLPDSYIDGLQQGTRRMGDVLRGYAGRVRELLRGNRYDLIWIEKEALPWVPGPLERLLYREGVPYVLDYDDAVFHQYDQHRSALWRGMLGGKHPALIRGASLVVAGNGYLAEFARNCGGTNVHVIPTVVDLRKYAAPGTRPGAGDRARIGWVGQRATAHFLQPYCELFARLTSETGARFAAIGIDAASLGLPMESIAWSEASEASSLQDLDVGIMPLTDGPFERGKCGYKLVQYMASGIPVVASPVGVNRDIVKHGVNGYLADTEAEWELALRKLVAEPELRLTMGAAGRRLVEEHFSLQAAAPKFAALLRAAVPKRALRP